jgi:hypothetical protein
LTPPKPVKVVIFREDESGNPANVTFLCGAVLDYGEFDKLCPEPKPPLVTKVGTGESYTDTNDSKFRDKVSKHSNTKLDWLVIQSLRATEGLEWETVNYSDPETWKNYETELKSFLTEGEYQRVFAGVLDANAPTSNRRREAMDVFTQSQAGEVGSVTGSPQGEPTNTKSSEPASVSV